MHKSNCTNIKWYDLRRTRFLQMMVMMDSSLSNIVKKKGVFDDYVMRKKLNDQEENQW